ncbi:MAG: PD-(D/E)XK nuclease family protein [Ignavibacteria bacterium]|nr:PD-(D/E)XK nuclease family protein [Ignavibacteria bacterium]
MDFIKRTAELIYENHKDNLKDAAVVFPSRRAGLYFKKELSGLISAPVWSPSVFSINDFVVKLSGLEITDNLTLVFELYESYSKYLETESFDEFYPWGEMLLKDFDVIDKYLVNSDLIFKRIKNEKEIELAFPIEVVEDVKKFWSSVIKLQEENKYKDNFLNIWENLNSVYKHFKNSLLSKNLAYEGLAIRSAAENIYKTVLPYKKIYFAGFNSLNKCEKLIFQTLVEKKIGETLWDTDKYFVDDDKQEAGFFIRKNLKVFENKLVESGTELTKGAKNISVTGSSLNTGMIKAFGFELKKFLEKNPGAEKNTAVILPDENALIPVLYSLPDNVDDINITMGLPFRTTPLFTLIKIIRKLQSGKIIEEKRYRYYHDDVIRLLLHPYMKFLFPEQIFGFIREIKDTNQTYIEPSKTFIKSLEDGLSKDILKLIFKPVFESADIIDYLSELSDLLTLRLEEYGEKGDNHKLFQMEYLYFMNSNLNRLKDIIDGKKIVLNQTTFWNLLVQQLNSSRIVFTGEPLKGLQVMGLLETRNLRFENVFMLSMNEGVMPAGSTFNSYIPYNLRKAFGLPTYEENDSINAYYIYSLIAKAKNIFLFYNTELGNDVKEKSRYILQIENELRNINTNISYSHKINSYPIAQLSEEKIEIIKDKSLLSLLKENVKRISPSDLSKYINCTLQFYFSKVIKLETEKKVEEILSPASFGTVFHETVRELYKPYIGKGVTEKDIEDIAARVETDFDNIFMKVLDSKEDLKYLNLSEKGRNTLSKSVIKKLVKRFLEAEKNRLPFSILALEKWVETGIEIETGGGRHSLNIAGKIDRIDESENIKTIIDYKTGDSKLKSLRNRDTFFENLFTDPGYKANFQTFFYVYLMYLTEHYDKCKAGIYALKEISNEGLQLMQDDIFTQEDIKLFGEELTKKIEEIFGSEIPFTKTVDVKRCEYCDYKDICGR